MCIQTYLTNHKNNFNTPSYIEIMKMLKFSQGKKFIETVSHYSWVAGLACTKWLTLALNSKQSFCLSFQSVEILSTHQHTQLRIFQMLIWFLKTIFCYQILL